jgi:hypothetical protein
MPSPISICGSHQAFAERTRVTRRFGDISSLGVEVLHRYALTDRLADDLEEPGEQ